MNKKGGCKRTPERKLAKKSFIRLLVLTYVCILHLLTLGVTVSFVVDLKEALKRCLRCPGG